MKNVITRLEVQKKNKKRVNVYLNDNYGFALNIMAAASLFKGQELSDDKIAELKKEDQQSRAYNSAIRFLGYRARSRAEIKSHLAAKGFEENIIEKTIDKLISEKLLNDADFSKQWVESRMRFNPKGAWALRQELLQKGVEETIIEAALDGHADDDAAWAAVRKKLDQWKKLDQDTFKKKIFTYLGNRGFSYETTRDTFNRVQELYHNE